MAEGKSKSVENRAEEEKDGDGLVVNLRLEGEWPGRTENDSTDCTEIKAKVANETNFIVSGYVSLLWKSKVIN